MLNLVRDFWLFELLIYMFFDEKPDFILPPSIFVIGVFRIFDVFFLSITPWLVR